MIELIPIRQTIEENQEFEINPDCHETLSMTLEYYKTIGFVPPWIGYFAKLNGKLVGSAGYKGKPIDNKIEIAYGTFPDFRVQGIGTEICRQLVELSQETDPCLKITARTLPEENFSTRILKKNNFVFIGAVIDPEDGEVWEWEIRYINREESISESL